MPDLVEASLEPIWEPEAILSEYEPHLQLLQELEADCLLAMPSRLWAHDVDGAPARLQQGMEAPCNADHQGVKDKFHVHLDPINPDVKLSRQAD